MFGDYTLLFYKIDVKSICIWLNIKLKTLCQDSVKPEKCENHGTKGLDQDYTANV